MRAAAARDSLAGAVRRKRRGIALHSETVPGGRQLAVTMISASSRIWLAQVSSWLALSASTAAR